MGDKQTHVLKVKQFDARRADRAAAHCSENGKKGQVASLEKAAVNHLARPID